MPTEKFALKCCLIMSIFCCAIDIKAQKQGKERLDSLRTALPSSKQISRVLILNDIAFELRTNAPDSAAIVANEARLLANLIGFRLGEADAYLIIGNTFESKANYDKALESLNTALKLYDRVSTDSKAVLNGKMRTYNGIGVVYYDRGEHQIAMDYYQIVLKIADSIGDDNNRAVSFNNIGNIFKAKGEYPEAIKFHKKSLEIRLRLGDKSGTGDSYQNLGIAVKAQGEYATALKYFFETLRLRGETGDLKGMADACNNVGNTYNVQGNYPAAISCHNKSLEIRLAIKDTKGVASSYNNVGLIYYNQGTYPLALKNFLAALKFHINIGNKNGIAKAYLNIGNVYYEQKMYVEALVNYKSALRIHIEVGDKQGIGSAHCNLGAVYSDMGDEIKGLKEYYLALVTEREVRDREGEVISNTGIGLILEHQQRYREALTHLHEALRISQEITDAYGIADASIHLAKIYLTFNKRRKASGYVTKGIKIANVLGSRELLRNGYEVLAKADSMRGDFKQAFAHYRLFIANRDSLYNIDSANRITQLKERYRADFQQDSLNRIHTEETVLAKQKSRFQLWLGGTVAVSFLALFAGASLLYQRRQKEKLRMEKDRHIIKMLINENEKLGLRQELFKAQLNSHFVTDTIAYIGQFIEERNIEVASKYIAKLSRLIRTVLANSSDKRKTSIKDEIDFTRDYIDLMLLKYSYGYIVYTIEIDSEIDSTLTLMPPMILQVIVENSILHGLNTTGGQIKVKLERQDSHVTCTVQDNGIGRDAATAKAIQNRKSYGTQLVDRLIDTWNVEHRDANVLTEDLKDENGLALGTKVCFTFPIINVHSTVNLRV